MYYPRKESQKNTHFILGIAQIGWDPTAQMDLDSFLKVKKIAQNGVQGAGVDPPVQIDYETLYFDTFSKVKKLPNL